MKVVVYFLHVSLKICMLSSAEASSFMFTYICHPILCRTPNTYIENAISEPAADTRTNAER